MKKLAILLVLLGFVAFECYAVPYIQTDSRYHGYISTGTGGLLTSTGTIVNVPELITDYTFYVLGGDAQIIFSGFSGFITLHEGNPYDRPTLAIPMLNTTIILKSLTPGATVDYVIGGGNK